MGLHVNTGYWWCFNAGQCWLNARKHEMVRLTWNRKCPKGLLGLILWNSLHSHTSILVCVSMGVKWVIRSIRRGAHICVSAIEGFSIQKFNIHKSLIGNDLSDTNHFGGIKDLVYKQASFPSERVNQAKTYQQYDERFEEFPDSWILCWSIKPFHWDVPQLSVFKAKYPELYIVSKMPFKLKKRKNNNNNINNENKKTRKRVWGNQSLCKLSTVKTRR